MPAMNHLYAFWVIGPDGRPTDPDALDPWGESSALDALDLYDPVGPWLTVLDADTQAVLFAGDASSALLAFAADVALRTGGTLDPDPTPIQAARQACSVLTDRFTDDAAHEAAYQWAAPDPDTWRRTATMSHAVRQGIRSSAQAHGRTEADAEFRAYLAVLVPFRSVRLAA